MGDSGQYLQDLKGKNLGSYKITRKLGEGGMGAVFCARDNNLDRDVAVKVLPVEYARDRSYIVRFEREAKALARLRHPNLVHIYTVGEEEGIHYFAMEFVEGETLGDYMRKRDRLSIDETLRFTSQILSALHAVHKLGITHRDIKAANIMIDQGGRAILMDFGLVKDRSQEGLTSVGAVLGTPEYMSPEQIEGDEVKPCSDLYSLGILMYEMLAGRLPYLGSNVMSVLRAHLEEKPPNLTRVRRDIPKELARVVHKAIAKKPQDRYESAAHMARDLLEIYPDPVLRDIAGDATDAATLRLQPVSGKTRFEKILMWFGAAFLVLIVLSILGSLGERQNNSDTVENPPAGTSEPGETSSLPPLGENPDEKSSSVAAGEPAEEPGEIESPPSGRSVGLRFREGGGMMRGKIVTLKATDEGPALVIETDDGEKKVVPLVRIDEIIYPRR